MKKWIFLVGAAIFGAVVYWLIKTSRAATESPVYTILRTDGDFELRKYPTLTIAQTATARGENDSGFQRLFRFISGHNVGKEKISMTTPVLIRTTPEGEKGTHMENMAFIMPRESVEEGLPAPDDKEVELEEIELGSVACYTYSGKQSPENEAEALEKLREWMKENHLEAMGQPIVAYYDPPWTPPNLRRNEVMLRVDQ